MSEKPDTDQSLKKARVKTTKVKGIPAKISIDDCLKAIKVLSDKGGTSKANDLEASFGGKKNRELLSRSLAALSRLNILEKSGATFSLGEMGGKFVVASEEEKKRTLAEKIISYPNYNDVFIRLNNESEKSVKKEDITDMWINIAGGGIDIRQKYTLTFSSLASWCGLVEDTGRTIKLKALGIRLLERKPSESGDILSPLSITQPPLVPPSTSQLPPPSPSTSPPSLSGLVCPICNDTEIGLKSEDIIQAIQTKSGHLIYLKYTYYCRNCRSEFTRLLQQSYESPAL